MAIYGSYEYSKYWIGLSTDTKPTVVRPGDEFFETDTRLTYIYSGSAWGQKVTAASGPDVYRTITDPGVSAAVTQAIVDAYSGVLITTTAAGNAQTIASPTITTAGKRFTVINNDTSSHSITVNGIVLAVGDAQMFAWDGTAWIAMESVYATTTSAGVMEIATDAEAVTGTDAVRSIVPASLTARLAAPGAVGGTTPAAGAFTTLKMTTGAAAALVVSDADGNLVADTTPALGTPSSGDLQNCTFTAKANVSLNRSSAPAAVVSFAGTISAASLTATFTEAADYALCVIGSTIISNAQTRYVTKLLGSSQVTLDQTTTWAGSSAITSIQSPQQVSDLSGTIIYFKAANGTPTFILTSNGSILDHLTVDGKRGIGTTGPEAQFEVMSTTGGTLRLKRDDGSVTTDEVIGTTEFYTNDGDGAHVAAYIRGLGADLAGQNYGRFGALSFGVSKTAMTDAVEAMRIALSGNVGIGTTGPTMGLLQVTQSSATQISSWAANSSAIGYINTPEWQGQGFMFSAGTANNAFSMVYNGTSAYFGQLIGSTRTEWMHFGGAGLNLTTGNLIVPSGTLAVSGAGNNYILGNVGIGTTGPIYTEDVNGPINSRVYYWCDDFDDEAAGVQLESALNADFWTTAGTNYAAANVTYLGGTGGTLKALCANADNDSVTILGLLNVNVTQNPILEARIKIDTKETAAFLIGFASAASAAIDTYPADCFLVGINSDNAHTFGAAQVVAFSNDANAGVDYDDMGVAIVSDTFIKIKIDLTDTEQPRVWINDTEVAAGSITGTVQAGIAMAPYIAVQNLAGGAIQRFVIVDCIKIWADRG